MSKSSRFKQESTRDQSPGPGQYSTDIAGSSKQKMLESRIEKLRVLEAQVKTDTVCSKKNCPVAIDARTTQERYGNASAEGAKLDQAQNKETRARIERFRTVLKQQSLPQSQRSRKLKQ